MPLRRARLAPLALAGALFVTASPAARAEEPLSGVEIAARAGYAFPFGTLAGTDSLSDLVTGYFAGVLDIGYRFNPHVFVGLSFQYGIMQVHSDSTTGCTGVEISCSGRDYSLGALVIYHLLPERHFDPWAGLGFGYEFMSILPKGPGQTGSITWRGFEYFQLMAGLDFATLVPRLYVAPMLQLSVGHFTAGHISIGSTSEALPMPSTSIHQWLTLGLRVTYVL